jgi:integrase
MATINKYKTPSGSDRWRVRWTDENGKQKSVSFKKGKDARKYLISLEGSLQEGTYVDVTDITLAQYLDDWIASIPVRKRPREKGLAANTIRGYKVNIAHIKRAIGLRKGLQKVTAADIEKAYTELAREPESDEKRRPLGGTSLLYIHRVLNQALKRAVRQGLIKSNPCDKVTAPEKNKETVAQFVHPDDVPAYLKTFEDDELYAAVCLAFFWGLRRGEALGLQWKNIDWKKRSAKIIDNMTYDGLGAPKPQKSRTIPITDSVLRILIAQKERQRHFKELLWDKYYKSDFVVTHDDGRPIEPRSMSKRYKAMLNRAELPFVRFHDLRHTTGSLLLMAGVDMKTVSEILGHSSIKITLDIYGHITEEHKREALNTLDKYLV